MQVELMTVLTETARAFSVSVRALEPPYSLENTAPQALEDRVDGISGLTQAVHDAADKLGYAEVMLLHGRFGGNYAMFSDPEKRSTLVMVGPWRTGGMTQERRGHILTLYGTDGAAAIEGWFQTVPLPPQQSFQTLLLNVIGMFFPGETLTLRHLNESETKPEPEVFSDSLFWQRYAEGFLEQRYEAENALMNAVASGSEREAFDAFRAFRKFDLGGRFAGSTDRRRHGLVILNTLLRKSIERANVHPYYIDEISRSFAERILRVETDEEKRETEMQMLREYTRYVREFALNSYSTPVRKTIQYINQNLDMDLSLMNLAEKSHISQSYLSNLFRRETGTTLTNYITQQRVFRATQLLDGTEMNIAEIAASVGILDENYFTKMFRKVAGVTPSRYRALHRKNES